MPYVLDSRRMPLLEGKISPPQWTPGDLNFMITVAVNAYIAGHNLSYTTINDVVGVLECAKLEMYRRLAAPYEDKKIVENGDVYGILEEKSPVIAVEKKIIQ